MFQSLKKNLPVKTLLGIKKNRLKKVMFHFHGIFTKQKRAATTY